MKMESIHKEVKIGEYEVMHVINVFNFSEENIIGITRSVSVLF